MLAAKYRHSHSIEPLERRALLCSDHLAAAATAAPGETLDASFARAQSDAAIDLDWTGKTSVSVIRDEAAGAAVGDGLFVFGGFDNGEWDATARVDLYHVDIDSWTRLRDMPEPLTHVATVVQGPIVWLIGGYYGEDPGPAVRSVYKYDTRDDTYTRGPTLPEARGAGAAALVGNTIVYFGGTDRARDKGGKIVAEDKGTTWTLDLDADKPDWKRVRKMPENRNHLAGVSVGGNVYAIGGQHHEAEDANPLNDVHRYNPKLDKWTAVDSLPGVTSHMASSTLVHNGQIVVVGGEYRHAYSRSEIYRYDPSADEWSTVGHLPEARRGLVAGVFGDKLIGASGAYNGGRQTGETIAATLPASL